HRNASRRWLAACRHLRHPIDHFALENDFVADRRHDEFRASPRPFRRSHGAVRDAPAKLDRDCGKNLRDRTVRLVLIPWSKALRLCEENESVCPETGRLLDQLALPGFRQSPFPRLDPGFRYHAVRGRGGFLAVYSDRIRWHARRTWADDGDGPGVDDRWRIDC